MTFGLRGTSAQTTLAVTLLSGKEPVLRTALIVVLASLASLTWASGAQAAVVWGSLTDPRGDAIQGNSGTSDLVSFSVRYDDIGTITVSWEAIYGPAAYSFYDLRGNIGVWDPKAKVCDIASTGSVAFLLRPVADHYPPGTVFYTVVNFYGDTVQAPVWADAGMPMTFSDNIAFARRGYNCVTNVALLGYDGGHDPSDVTFCMGPSGTISCPEIGQRIGVRWVSPREGQTVSGFLHEGRSTCWAESDGPVVRTENWVDGRLHDRQNVYPWGCEWDTRQYSNGFHTLTVKAFAADGRVVEDTVRVNVSNANPVIPPTPPPPTTENALPPVALTIPVAFTAQPAAPAMPSPGGSTGAQPPALAPPPPLSLSTARAKASARRALARKFGKRYTMRARRGSTLTCRKLSSTRATCKVAWRYRDVRYSGTVRVTRNADRTSAILRIKRQRR